MTNFSASKYPVVIFIGLLAFSGCAASPVKTGAPAGDFRIAVMPMENLSGTSVPLKGIEKSLKEGLRSKGFLLLDDDSMEKFMERHRVRYAGGLTEALGKDFLSETGTKAVLFVSLDQYDEAAPPKMALTARLVSTAGMPAVLWMEGVAMAGNDAPGFLLLGMINDPWALWNKVRDEVVDSLADRLAGKNPRSVPQGALALEKHEEEMDKYRPKDIFRGLGNRAFEGEKKSIAVLPLANDSTRRNAGDIMALHLVRRLSEHGSFEVSEPGVVRQALLMSRTIMEGGLSIPQADLLREMLGVDLVMSGNVYEYDDYSGPGGNPKVNFTVRIYDTKTRQVVWSSISFNRGDDRVIFFNQGRVNTAYALASGMTRAVVERMMDEDGNAAETF
ncbi:MAG: hypothetical protein HY896_06690 [Deltaproteobacteria bacterium]|nr:hypothetical protein [Deltaproteobacteria bacterium]